MGPAWGGSVLQSGWLTRRWAPRCVVSGGGVVIVGGQKGTMMVEVLQEPIAFASSFSDIYYGLTI